MPKNMTLKVLLLLMVVLLDSVICKWDDGCTKVSADGKYLNCGSMTGDKAHKKCKGKYDLPVIRSKEELQDIQKYIGSTSKEILDRL